MKTAEFYAQQIVNYARENDLNCSNLQLQKVLFFLQVLSYKNHSKPCIIDDFTAFQYGPVVFDLYARFAERGSLNIKMPEAAVVLDNDEIKLIDSCLRNFVAWELVEFSHKKGGAWDKTWRDGAGRGKIIPKNLIEKDAYSGLYL